MRQGRTRRDYDRRHDLATLDKLRAMGVNLIPIELPKLPYGAMSTLLGAEAAAAFDDLTLSGRDALLTEQGVEDWPNTFRIARFYPAVEYIQANRARTIAIQQVSALFEQVDIIVTPSTDTQLVATNLTGHPALILPNGLRGADAPKPPKIDDGDHDDIGGPGTPVSITFLAAHYQDAKLAAFGWAYQQATGFHKLHPKLDWPLTADQIWVPHSRRVLCGRSHSTIAAPRSLRSQVAFSGNNMLDRLFIHIR